MASELTSSGLGALSTGESERALEYFRSARDRFDELARRAAASAAEEAEPEVHAPDDPAEVDTGAVDVDRAGDAAAQPPEEGPISERTMTAEEAIDSLLETYRRALEAEDRQLLGREVYAGSIPDADEEDFYRVWFQNAENLRVELDLRELRFEGESAVALVRQLMRFRLARTGQERRPSLDLRFHFQGDSAGWRLVRIEQ